mmetsp:Transcript_80499/g.186909  ORF Transcript_80499/g.186909 Transcript_80499/m.186909 type:complete len:260 (-) Transcript_80499:299-1078(-)
MKVDMANVPVWPLRGVHPEEALVGGRSCDKCSITKVERSAVIRVAVRWRQGKSTARCVVVGAEAELLKCLVNAGAEDLLVIWRKAAHDIQGICVKEPHRLARVDRLPQVPHLARVIKRSRGKHVGGSVRKTENVDEVLVQATEGAEPPSRHNVVKAEINTKATGHEVVVGAINRQGRKVREWLQLDVLHATGLALVVPDYTCRTRLRSPNHSPLRLCVQPGQTQDRIGIDLQHMGLRVCLMVEDSYDAILAAREHDARP